MPYTNDKARESRLRRAAARQGLSVAKSSRRNTQAPDFGTYMLTDPHTNAVVALGLLSGYGLTLDDVETELTARVSRSQ